MRTVGLLCLALAFKQEFFEVALGVTFANQMTNDGFSYERLEPIEGAGAVSMMVMDLGVFPTDRLRLGLQSWIQMNDSAEHSTARIIALRASGSFAFSQPSDEA